MYALVVLVNLFFCLGLTTQLFFQRTAKEAQNPFGVRSAARRGPVGAGRKGSVGSASGAGRETLKGALLDAREKVRKLQAYARKLEQSRKHMAHKIEEDRRLREKLQAKLEEERLARETLHARLKVSVSKTQRTEREREALRTMLATLCNNTTAMEKLLVELKTVRTSFTAEQAAAAGTSNQGDDTDAAPALASARKEKSATKRSGAGSPLQNAAAILAQGTPDSEPDPDAQSDGTEREPEPLPSVRRGARRTRDMTVDEAEELVRRVADQKARMRPHSPQPQDSDGTRGISTSSVCSLESSLMTLKSCDSYSTYERSAGASSVLTDDYHESRARQSDLYNCFELDSDQGSL